MTNSTNSGASASNTLAGALGLSELGFHVFPLRHDDKRPAIGDWENRATADRDRITAAWSGPYAGAGIGLACGPSGVVVVDLDTAKGDPGPEPGITDGADVLAALYEQHGQEADFPLGITPTVRTGSGGMHAYFRAPGARPVRNSAGRIGWKIDVRAHGGYVVAPPSTAAGKPYAWDFGTGPHTPLADLPDWLLELAAPVRPVPAPRVPDWRLASRPTGFMSGLIKVVLEARQGQRNERLFWAACKAGEHAQAGHIDRQRAADSLLAAALDIGLDEKEARGTITSGYRAANGRTP
ncbi:bifunctional DNA primase/polymerase [Yinghuangia sp. ASG 101]|uniref:bifunctional DNA primase/polymerase n=1 Tax=Yinghuangia sp. ASG 101 TaxID=2896848 RepID=UPI001E41770C|nr:bifunctional DNA primase/polymerase [Yinghuangia sp. ASG 101]UGQ15025.1 bifunctional DNA primase/polymerase [Yinghuangia sp. ASG 101]